MMEGPGAESEEKREPASDIETAAVDSLKCLTQIGRLEKRTCYTHLESFGSYPNRKVADTSHLPIGRRLSRPLCSPFKQFVKCGAHPLSPLGQSVFDLRRHLWKDGSDDNAVALQFTKETPGIANSSSEKRNTPRANRWKMMTIFQRPSSIRNAPSTPRAAMSGVTSSSLPVGEYPTFLSVLATR